MVLSVKTWLRQLTRIAYCCGWLYGRNVLRHQEQQQDDVANPKRESLLLELIYWSW